MKVKTQVTEDLGKYNVNVAMIRAEEEIFSFAVKDKDTAIQLGKVLENLPEILNALQFYVDSTNVESKTIDQAVLIGGEVRRRLTELNDKLKVR